MSVVSEFTGMREEKIQRCFACLLKLYHPDRTKFYKRFIMENYQAGNLDQLHRLGHIFRIEQMDFQKLRSAHVDEDIDYDPEEVWDDSDPGFDIVGDGQMEHEEAFEDWQDAEQEDQDFLSAVKRKIYGPMEIDMPVHLLEDLEEIEMAEYDISTLDGIRYCRYAITMDLSGNHINDLTEIAACKSIKELYLSHNQISIIDPLCVLSELTELDISYNQVDDLSPLSRLPHLEYVNVMGNPVPRDQIEELKTRGILVVN
jgi:hypothetical protein